MNKILVISLVLCLAVGLSKSAATEPVEAVYGKIKINGLMQWWYQYDSGSTPKDTFRLRRAEIKLSGEIKPEVSWIIMIDPAQVREDTDRKSPLQDFVITLKPYKYFSIDFGQYKVPFGMEGLESSAKLDFIERAALATQFKWADYRDIGFTLKGDFKVNNVKIQPQAGIFNGEGHNKLDVNEIKDFVGRLVIKPIETLHLGIAHYSGKSDKIKTDNYRTGGEIKFVQGSVSAYGEYATGKSGGKEKQTYYISAGYKFSNSWQVVARYDWYDSDTTRKDDEKHESTIGLNYFIEKHNAKLQLNYVYCGEKGRKIDNDVMRVNLQISF